MRVGVIGINHKLADLKLREALAKACQKHFAPSSWRHDAQTFVLLSTCNRTEVYFYSDDLTKTHSELLNILRHEIDQDFEQKLYSYFGCDCFFHLARVTAGLDSAIVGETEIQGQVKTSYEAAAKSHQLPGVLHLVFQKALKIGKQVRHQLHIGHGMPDLEHAVYNAGMHLFKDVASSKVLLIGASVINSKICSLMKSRGIQDISLCNRTHSHAEEFAGDHSLSIKDWSEVGRWHQYDWIIFGTKCPSYLLTKDDIPEYCVGPKLIIDLCVPRNVDPRMGRDPRVTLMNIDQINRMVKYRRQLMNHTLRLAELQVVAAVDRHKKIFSDRERHCPCVKTALR